MILLDGKLVSKKIQERLQNKINKLVDIDKQPCLNVILIGDSPESLSYVKMKEKKCKEMNILIQIHHHKETIPEKDILSLIHSMNNDDTIHGILVQLPLPKQINTHLILNEISKEKDVDGFHYYNAGKLFQNKDYLFAPCTPKGCIELLNHYNINIKGLNITIIGCSNLVGLPLSMMLLHKGATVTICHIDTVNTKEHCLSSDMVISCCGVPHLIKEDWIKEGTIVIDIGTTKVKDSKQLIGDVDFENVKTKCSHITPVPGGIGPMTIIMLIQQTIEACERN